METKVLIYCLYDPIECKIRYIGRTTKKVLDHRLIEHITKSRYHNRYYPGKKATHKVNWINFLIKEGREPKIKKLCEVIGWKESHIFERDLIKKYDEKRDLTNADDRGIGHKNKIITDEQKIQISNTLKKFYETKLNSRAKCIEVYDLNGKFLETYESATEFAKILKVPPRFVTRVANATYGRRMIRGRQVKYCSDPRIIKEYKPLKALRTRYT